MFKDYEFEGIDLQLFAVTDGDPDEDEDLEDLGYTGDPDEDEDLDDDKDPDDVEEDEDKDPDEDLEEEFEDKDPDEEEDEDSKAKKKPTKKVDKVTAALIEEKRKRKEAERKLQAIEDAKAEEAQEKANEARIQKLVADGYGEEQAKHMVTADAKSEKLELEIQKLKFEKLEKKYPGISDHTKEILDIVKKSNGALTAEEVYNAKFRSTSEYDIKTKAEAAALHKQKEAKQKQGKSGTGGNEGNKKPVTLSASDERAYNHLTRQRDFKNLTKAQYLKRVKGGEIEE